MSDETQAPVEETDKPVETADTTDWEQQYKALQPEYTRNQQALKDAQSVWEDEQALIARIGEKFPHLIAEEEDEPEVEDELDEPEAMTKQEFKVWQDEQQAEKASEKAHEQFETDFKGFVGDRELDQYGEAALRAGTYKGPEELEAAINGYFDYIDGLGGTKRKKRPTPPLAGGKTATGVPNYDDMSRDQINEAMVERARALEAQ